MRVKLKVKWVPGHCRIKGNSEQLDKEAKRAAKGREEDVKIEGELKKNKTPKVNKACRKRFWERCKQKMEEKRKTTEQSTG